MLVVQPFLEFEDPTQEPFPLSQACNQRLLDAIDSVFETSGAHRPHVILFPEFALPGVEGVKRVATRLSSEAVASPTIVIAGVSGLPKVEYEHLCALPNVAVVDDENASARVQDTEWVNTSVTFVKDNNGALSLWVQPKLSPSWPEANYHHQAMFQGSLVRSFRAQFDNDVPCRFLSLLCFDWVGQETGLPVPEAVLQAFDLLCRDKGSPQDLQWVFVLQHNRSPNHPSFLTSTYRFLTQPSYPFVRRRDASVIMVSTASSRRPARSGPYGFSSLVFGPQAPFDSSGSRPTFATQPSRLRQSDTLGACKDVVFREMGECIHLFDVRIPNFVVADPTDRTAALIDAQALPLLGDVVDPRIPGRPVPAVVKWVNDELDNIPDFCATYFTHNPIEPALRRAHAKMVDGYRYLRSQDLALRIDGACASRAARDDSGADPAADVDTAWDANERLGLHHVIQTLTLVGGAVNLDPVDAQLHARSELGVEIAAIAGATHYECLTAFKKFAARTHSPIVFVARDANNAVHLPREAESFADPQSHSGVRFTDAQTLLTEARTKPQNQYTQFVAELLNVDDRRII